MSKLRQIKELAELGFAESVQCKDSKSKDFFISILMKIEQDQHLKSKSEVQLSRPSDINLPPSGDKDYRENRTYKKIRNTEDANTIAYYLSKYEHKDLAKGESSQGETIAQLANILGINHNSLRNMRDAFDRYTGSHRKGWNKPLNDVQQKIFDSLEAKSKEEVCALVNNILEHNILEIKYRNK